MNSQAGMKTSISISQAVRDRRASVRRNSAEHLSDGGGSSQAQPEPYTTGYPRTGLYDFRSIRNVEIELTTRCGAACPMCPRNAFGGAPAPDLPKAELSLADIQKIFDQEFLRQIELVYFCGTYGDPSLARDTLAIIDWLKSNRPGLRVRMATNGGARTARWWRALGQVLDQRDAVTFSIDGLADTNHLYRQRIDWKRLVRHAEAFIDAGGQGVWEFLVFRHNEHQVDQARDLACAMGFRRFVCKKTYRYHHKDHTLLNPFPVRNVRGEIQRHLQEPVDPALCNPGLSEVAARLEQEDWGHFLDRTPVQCLVRQQKLLHITAEGLAFPCGWLYDRLYGTHASSPSARQFQRLLAENGGKAAIDAKARPLAEIVHGPVFSAIAESWERPGIAVGKLERCAVQCGALAPARSQRRDESDNVFPIAEH